MSECRRMLDQRRPGRPFEHLTLTMVRLQVGSAGCNSERVHKSAPPAVAYSRQVHRAQCPAGQGGCNTHSGPLLVLPEALASSSGSLGGPVSVCQHPVLSEWRPMLWLAVLLISCFCTAPCCAVCRAACLWSSCLWPAAPCQPRRRCWHASVVSTAPCCTIKTLPWALSTPLHRARDRARKRSLLLQGWRERPQACCAGGAWGAGASPRSSSLAEACESAPARQRGAQERALRAQARRA